MLAGDFPEGTTFRFNGPSVEDAIGAVGDGAINIVTSGEFIYALVLTQETTGDDTLRGSGEIRSRALYIELDSGFANTFDLVDIDSDRSFEITQDERNRLRNQRVRFLAEAIDGAAYVGETGSGELRRINLGFLPTVSDGEETEDILDLGFDQQRNGSADSEVDLPDVITYGDNVGRAINRVRGRSTRTDRVAGAILRSTGRVASEFGVFDAIDEGLVVEGVEDVADAGRIVVLTSGVSVFELGALPFADSFREFL